MVQCCHVTRETETAHWLWAVTHIYSYHEGHPLAFAKKKEKKKKKEEEKKKVDKVVGLD